MIIALLTDFGITDTYVGVMKGVMLGIAPHAQLIDLTHAIQPQNVRQGAFTLLNSYRYFPPETIFLVVVDPGVGSTRFPIAVQAGDYRFVAPDNGVLSYMLHEIGGAQAVQLNNPAYQLKGVSNTFHGRDIFAPAAAHLAAGVSLEALGSPISQPVTIPAPSLRVEGNRIIGEVLHIDHFGNAVTSIGLLQWSTPQRLTLNTRFGDSLSLPISAVSVVITAAKQTLHGIKPTYGEVARGEAVAIVGSSGYLELSVNQGSFAAYADLQIGDPVEVQTG